jgi:hypothetical protein
VDGYRVDAVPFLFEGPIDGRPDNEYGAPQHLPETYDMVTQWRVVMDEKTQVDNRTK